MNTPYKIWQYILLCAAFTVCAHDKHVQAQGYDDLEHIVAYETKSYFIHAMGIYENSDVIFINTTQGFAFFNKEHQKLFNLNKKGETISKEFSDMEFDIPCSDYVLINRGDNIKLYNLKVDVELSLYSFKEGKILWSKHIEDQGWKILESICVDDRMFLHVLSDHGVDHLHYEEAFWMDLKTGEIEEHLVTVEDGYDNSKILHLASNGKIIVWGFNVKDAIFSSKNIVLLNDILKTWIATKDRIYSINKIHNELIALNLENGVKVWSQEIKKIKEPGTYYLFSSSDHIFLIADIMTGSGWFVYDHDGHEVTAKLIEQKILAIIDDQENIYFLSRNLKFHVFNKTTHEFQETPFNLSLWIDSRSKFSIIQANNEKRFIVYDEDYVAVAFDLDKGKILWSIGLGWQFSESEKANFFAKQGIFHLVDIHNFESTSDAQVRIQSLENLKQHTCVVNGYVIEAIDVDNNGDFDDIQPLRNVPFRLAGEHIATDDKGHFFATITGLGTYFLLSDYYNFCTDDLCDYEKGEIKHLNSDPIELNGKCDHLKNIKIYAKKPYVEPENE